VSQTPARSHPALGLDDVVHQRVRLALLSVLVETGQAEFTYLRQLLELSDGNLGKHLNALSQAGYVELRKQPAAQGRARTWARVTRKGRRAFRDELTALEELIANHRRTEQHHDG